MALNEKQTALAVRAAVGAAGIGILALAAPVIIGAATAGLGILAIGGIGVVAIGAFQALPLLGQKWENKLLAARKAEARKNPIEQLQNYLLEKHNQVKVFRSAVVQIGTQIKSMSDMVADRKAKKPGYDARKQEESLAMMKGGHEKLVIKYKNAEKALVELEEIIDDKKFEWNFGQAGQLAVAQLNAVSGEDLLNQMLADEAFSSVRDNFNTVFAELEIEAAKLNNGEQLTYDGGLSIDLSSIRIPSLQTTRSM